MRTNLPKGLNYKIEEVQTGAIIPGTEKDPIITVYGKDVCIQYRLISYALGEEDIIQETYNTSGISDEDIDAIDDWLFHIIPSLLREVGVKHTIRFKAESSCYFDFDIGALYGASGVKEKKGSRDGNRENTKSLNGEECKLAKSEIAFITVLTRTPNAPYSWELLEDEANLTHKSLQQTWSRFRKYDSSISDTFEYRKGPGTFAYTGQPQSWFVGDELSEVKLSIVTIYKLMDYLEIIARIDRHEHKLQACHFGELSAEHILDFLGLSVDFFDMGSIGIEEFVEENYSNSDIALIRLMDKCSTSLDAVWEQLRKSISENITLSLSASTFYRDTNFTPERMTDLKAYSVTAERMEISLNRICHELQKVIEQSSIGSDYFTYCDVSIKPERAIDYIVALVMTCIGYCKAAKEEEHLSISRSRYRSKLKELIRSRFNYCPPNGGQKSIIEIIQNISRTAQHLMMEDRIEEAYSELEKINDFENIISYNDANSVISTSKGRGL